VDGWLGDCVAGLPDSERGTPRFALLARSWGTLANALLSHEDLEPASLRLIRRFGAALLGDVAESDDGGALF
jgi:hypothetical protein